MTITWPSCERSDRDHALIFLISHRSSLDQFSFPAAPRAGRRFADIRARRRASSTSFHWAHWLDVTGSFRCDVPRGTCRCTGWPSRPRGQMVASGRDLVWSIEEGSDTHRQTAAAAIRIAAVCDRRGAIRAIQQTLAIPVFHL